MKYELCMPQYSVQFSHRLVTYPQLQVQVQKQLLSLCPTFIASHTMHGPLEDGEWGLL
jgi:hypothetical protein